MRRYFLVLFVAVAMISLTSFTFAEEFPKPDADAVWHYITKTSPYGSWQFWPDHQGIQEGSAPHGPLHKVFVNEPGLTSAHAPANNHTIIVKENLDKNQMMKAITIMYKAKGYNPKAGDWFWAKYAPDGSVAAAGKVDSCIQCHGSMSANDYVMVHILK